jgi:hypothetical protein
MEKPQMEVNAKLNGQPLELAKPAQVRSWDVDT